MPIAQTKKVLLCDDEEELFDIGDAEYRVGEGLFGDRETELS